jgi:hypothetical protein
MDRAQPHPLPRRTAIPRRASLFFFKSDDALSFRCGHGQRKFTQAPVHVPSHRKKPRSNEQTRVDASRPLSLLWAPLSMFRTAHSSANTPHASRRLEVKRYDKELRYPHRLNFYHRPPLEEITVEEFETWAIDRLRSMTLLPSKRS